MTQKKLLEIMEASKTSVLLKHKPAKDAYIPIEEEQQEIDDFKAALEQHFLDKMDTSRFVEADGFHPSVLGTKFGHCARYSVYMLRGTRKENTFSSRVLRILASGNYLHERTQTALDELGISIANEIPIEWDDPPIKGHADGAIRWAGKVILIEIKSIGNAGFEMRVKWKKPKPEHFEQANLYSYVLDIPIIWFIYLNKNNEDILILPCKQDRIAAEKQIEKWRKTYNIFLDGDLPKRPYKKESEACLACPLKTTCWSDLE